MLLWLRVGSGFVLFLWTWVRGSIPAPSFWRGGSGRSQPVAGLGSGGTVGPALASWTPLKGVVGTAEKSWAVLEPRLRLCYQNAISKAGFLTPTSAATACTLCFTWRRSQCSRDPPGHRQSLVKARGNSRGWLGPAEAQ